MESTGFVTTRKTAFGLLAAARPAEGHYGLQGLRERVSRFDGQVAIESQPGQGAVIRVTIPRAKLEG